MVAIVLAVLIFIFLMLSSQKMVLSPSRINPFIAKKIQDDFRSNKLGIGSKSKANTRMKVPEIILLINIKKLELTSFSAFLAKRLPKGRMGVAKRMRRSPRLGVNVPGKMIKVEPITMKIAPIA